ncbi:MAG: hypothetical protein QXX68_01800 [Candidatus Pacearchaeota archaeon]
MAYTITEFLNQMNQLGVFSYVLPFMFVFAIVFGLLQKTKILGDENKARGINAIIALAIGGISLLFDVVPKFFSIIFPKFGVGLAVFLVLMIMIGFFYSGNKEDSNFGSLKWIGIVVGLVVLIWALSEWGNLGGFGNFGFGFLSEFFPLILILIIIIVGISFVVGGGGKKE